MPIRSIMKAIFTVSACILLFAATSLFAAPLEGGYTLAPKSSATPQERDQAFINARLRVIEAAKKYEGTPYRYGGMSTAGVDCSGFLGLSFKDALGVALPRSASGLYSWTVRTTLEKTQQGDFLFFKTDNNSGSITHVGLYLGDRVFIHAASQGPKTGVIYSTLDEKYWANAYAGAGRAFPESTPFNVDKGGSTLAGVPPKSGVAAGSGSRNSPPSHGGSLRPAPVPSAAPSTASSDDVSGKFLLGFAVAPIWNSFIKGVDMVRGVTSQFGIIAETYSFGPKMVFGLELRPEYDGGLGVFRLPITLSWGPSEQIRVFFGPVFSFGDASIKIGDDVRYYSGGTSWLGTAGITAAPFVFKTKSGDFSPYIEAAWQSYFSDSGGSDFASDFSAGFRFSTGVRWILQVR